MRPVRKHRLLGRRAPVAMIRAGLMVVILALLAPAVSAPLAPAATAPDGHAKRHTSAAAHRGKCARHARRRAHRSGRRHHHCAARRHAAPKTPAPALVLVAPAGPTVQPLAPIFVPPLASPPATSAPASEGAKPGEGGAETGESVEPPSIPHVQVSAVEYAFTLSRTTVPAGKVIFQFVNNGQDEHNLKIATSEGPLAGSFANTPAKGISDLQLEIQPGEYKLFCSLPTHEQKGMKATLTVE
jgi:plastocyanin